MPWPLSTRPYRAGRCHRSISEALESRMLLSGSPAIQMDRWLLAALNTPRLRHPGTGVYMDPSLISVSPDAPALGSSWDAVNMSSNSANNHGWLYIPPDPIGAAGPTQVVNIVNCSIEWYTKSGTLEHSTSLGNEADGTFIAGSFFSSLNPVDGLFDPKVLYDQYNGRFVVISLEQQDIANGAPVNSSRVLIAVSDDSDPNGAWYYQSIDTKMNISGVDTWFDYPGLAIGSDAIYLTGNMFSFGASGTFRASRLWIIDKAGLYGGGASSVNVYDPSTLAGLSKQDFTLQPAHMFGAAPGSVGDFFVASGWSSGPTDYLSVITLKNPLTSPSFSNTFISLGNVHNNAVGVPRAPQLGTSTKIDAGDSRVYSAVWRNNSLYLGMTVNPPNGGGGVDAGSATAHWVRLNATAASVSFADQGNVGGEDIAADTSTYYPAVNVDAYGNMAIGFAASSPSTYAGAYYTGRLGSDPAGTVQSSGLMAAGLDYYVRTFGYGRNRWGDFTGMALDPADETTFWVYNEYAWTRGSATGGEDGRWATRWGHFSLLPPSATPGIPDLDGAYDSGVSSTDDLTRLNNSSGASALLFDVSGTAAGATVEILADGTLVGSAVAAGTSTSVLTDGLFLLSDGGHSITARQTEPGKTATISSSLSITIDTTAPAALPAVINDGNVQRSMINQITASFSEAVSIASLGLDLRLRSGGAVPNVSVNVASADSVSYVLTFSGTAVIGGSLPDGMYRLARTASLIGDLAGNALPSNYSESFHRLFGDSDGDRDVDNVDLYRFKLAMRPGGYLWYFDYQYADPEGGTINVLDYQQFKSRLTRTLLL